MGYTARSPQPYGSNYWGGAANNPAPPTQPEQSNVWGTANDPRISQQPVSAEQQIRDRIADRPQGQQGFLTQYQEQQEPAQQTGVWGTENDPRLNTTPPAPQANVWGTENDPRLGGNQVGTMPGQAASANSPYATSLPGNQQQLGQGRQDVWGTENDPRIRANGGVTTPQTTQATPVQQETANQLRSGSPPLPTRRRSSGFPRSVQRNMWSRS